LLIGQMSKWLLPQIRELLMTLMVEWLDPCRLLRQPLDHRADEQVAFFPEIHQL